MKLLKHGETCIICGHKFDGVGDKCEVCFIKEEEREKGQWLEKFIIYHDEPTGHCHGPHRVELNLEATLYRILDYLYDTGREKE